MKFDKKDLLAIIRKSINNIKRFDRVGSEGFFTYKTSDGHLRYCGMGFFNSEINKKVCGVCFFGAVYKATLDYFGTENHDICDLIDEWIVESLYSSKCLIDLNMNHDLPGNVESKAELIRILEDFQMAVEGIAE